MKPPIVRQARLIAVSCLATSRTFFEVVLSLATVTTPVDGDKFDIFDLFVDVVELPRLVVERIHDHDVFIPHVTIDQHHPEIEKLLQSLRCLLLCEFWYLRIGQITIGAI